MTYQYQEVKKTEEKQEPDLFDYEQQHKDVAQEQQQRVEHHNVEKESTKLKEQQAKKHETGYEPKSTKEVREAHNKQMEELYGVKSQAEEKQEPDLFDKEQQHQEVAKAWDYYSKEGIGVEKQTKKSEVEKTTQKKLEPGRGLITQTLFPTLVHRGSLPISAKIDPPLIKHCYKLKKEWEEKKQPSLNRSVKMGWQSRPNIQELPELKDFVKCLQDATNYVFQIMKVPKDQHMPMLDTVWYNICPKGGYNETHVHPGAFLSGVYYLKKPEKSGDINFHDPRKGSMCSREPQHIARGSLQRVDTKAGDIIIFPGWLEHSVEPNFDEEDRISISFNVSWGYKPGHGYMEDFIENKQKEVNEEKKVSNAYG